MVVKALETITLARVDDGTAGKDITSYASGTALPATVAPANSQFWLTNSAGVAIKFYKSTGSSWVEQQISASAINAATFNGLNFNGVTFTGSSFTSTFNQRQLEVYGSQETDTFTRGDMSMTGGHFTVNHTDSITQNGDAYNTGLLQLINGGLYTKDQTPAGEQWFVGLSGGALSLMHKTADGVITTGVVDANWMSMVNACGTVLWTGGAFMNGNQTITPTRAISNCLNGWLLEWQGYSNGKPTGTGIMSTPIYKTDVAKYSGTGFSLTMIGYNQTPFSKYVYPTDTTITGNDRNSILDQPKVYVLSQVTAF
jgi:hypothetical protein